MFMGQTWTTGKGLACVVSLGALPRAACLSPDPQVGLLVIDEIHLLGADRGPTLEVIVSRMRYIAAQTERPVRFVGLSTALANAQVRGHASEGAVRHRPSAGRGPALAGRMSVLWVLLQRLWRVARGVVYDGAGGGTLRAPCTAACTYLPACRTWRTGWACRRRGSSTSSPACAPCRSRRTSR